MGVTEGKFSPALRETYAPLLKLWDTSCQRNNSCCSSSLPGRSIGSPRVVEMHADALTVFLLRF